MHAEAEAKRKALVEQDRAILRQSGVRGKLEELKAVLPKGAEIVEVDDGRRLELRWDHGKCEKDEEIRYKSIGVRVSHNRQEEPDGLDVIPELVHVSSTKELTEALVEAALKPGILYKHPHKPKEHSGGQPEGYRGGYV